MWTSSASPGPPRSALASEVQVAGGMDGLAWLLKNGVTGPTYEYYLKKALVDHNITAISS